MFKYGLYNVDIRSNPKEKKMLSDFARRFGSVQVGHGFECEKHNGNKYAGEIVKVAAYAKGTLVTIRFSDEDGPVHKSIYLEDCKEWFTEEPARY